MSFVESSIKRSLDRLYVPLGSNLTLNHDVPKAIFLFPAYFLGKLSKDVANNLNNLIHTYCPQVNLGLLHKSQDSIGSRFWLKDRIPVDCTSCLNNKYTCDNCNAVYIVKTAPTFKVRVSQHMGISTGANLSTAFQSDIREPCLNLT